LEIVSTLSRTKNGLKGANPGWFGFMFQLSPAKSR